MFCVGYPKGDFQGESNKDKRQQRKILCLKSKRYFSSLKGQHNDRGLQHQHWNSETIWGSGLRFVCTDSTHILRNWCLLRHQGQKCRHHQELPACGAEYGDSAGVHVAGGDVHVGADAARHASRDVQLQHHVLVA